MVFAALTDAAASATQFSNAQAQQCHLLGTASALSRAAALCRALRQDSWFTALQTALWLMYSYRWRWELRFQSDDTIKAVLLSQVIKSHLQIPACGGVAPALVTSRFPISHHKLLGGTNQLDYIAHHWGSARFVQHQHCSQACCWYSRCFNRSLYTDCKPNIANKVC